MDDWERLWGTPQSVVSLAPQISRPPGHSENGPTEMWTLVLPGGVPAKAQPAGAISILHRSQKSKKKSDPFLKEVDPQRRKWIHNISVPNFSPGS